MTDSRYQCDKHSHPEIVSALIGSISYLGASNDEVYDLNGIFAEANKVIILISDEEGNISPGRLLTDSINMILNNCNIRDTEEKSAIMDIFINTLNSTI